MGARADTGLPRVASPRLAQVVSLAQQGLRTEEIARRTGLSPMSVRTYLCRARAAGVQIARRRGGPQPTRRPEVVRLAREGLDAAAIAARLGIGSAAVHRHLRLAARLGEYDGPPEVRRRVTIVLPEDVVAALGRHAWLRGTAVDALARRILAEVTRQGADGGDLVDAVLDDMGGGDE